MIKGREELWNLRNVLERLLDFIQEIEAEELPYFYRCFDTMKNNIEIFFCVGCEDIEDLFPVLERDWKASHKVFIGVQYYNVCHEHPETESVLCLHFAKLLAEVGKQFDKS